MTCNNVPGCAVLVSFEMVVTVSFVTRVVASFNVWAILFLTQSWIIKWLMKAIIQTAKLNRPFFADVNIRQYFFF